MRLVLGLLAGAASSALAALILGEYEMTGWTPYLCGLAFGLVVAEVVTSVARRSGIALALACAALAGGGMVWAAWISSGRDWSYVPGAVWVGVGLALAAALVLATRPLHLPADGIKPSAPPEDGSR